MKILILEDDHERQKQFLKNFNFPEIELRIVETAEEAIKEIKSDSYNCAFLDHDLGGEVYVDSFIKNTGAEVARWISENKPEFPCMIHSLNPIGREYMVSIIPISIPVPFLWNANENEIEEIMEWINDKTK